MNVELTSRRGTDYIQIDDARLIYRNFSGREERFNREGDRNFQLVIPNQEIADMLINDTNENGVGWNVKISPPREEGEQPFIKMKVKVKFTQYGPTIWLKSGNSEPVKLTEETVGCLDHIDIAYCDLDIRAFDGEAQGKPFRAAYLDKILVVQEVDRFARRLAEEEYPEEY